MSRLLDQLRNAALTRLGRESPVADTPSVATPGVDAGNNSQGSSSLLVQAMQGSARTGADAAEADSISTQIQDELRSSALTGARAEADREAAQAAVADTEADRTLRIATEKRAQADAQAAAAARLRLAEEQHAAGALQERMAAETAAVQAAEARVAAEQAAEQAARANVAELERLTRLEQEREQIEIAAEAAARDRARADAEVEARARTLERQQLKAANAARQRAESERIALQRQKGRAEAEATRFPASQPDAVTAHSAAQTVADEGAGPLAPAPLSPENRHPLPRLAVAAMAATAVFGLGYWTGLPDPGVPANAPGANAGRPSVLALQLDRDVDALSRRLGSGTDRASKK